MITIDTSVAVAAIATWHKAHEEARKAARGASIAEHALLETYAVLTRLPRPLAPHDAADVLQRRFPPDLVLAPAVDASELVRTCSDLGLAGGATYDALTGLTARAHGAQLLTRDRHASRTYDALGVDVSWHQ